MDRTEPETRPVRVLSLSTLYPNAEQPNFGVFVQRQMQAVGQRSDVQLTLLNTVGLPPWPLSLHPRYRALRRNTGAEEEGNLTVLRSKFPIAPGIGGRFNPYIIARKLLPTVRRLHRWNPFDVLDAQFFYPDGPAIALIARELNLPYSIKARGADIHLWGRRPDTAGMVLAAARGAAGLLAVSDGLASDMVAMGISRNRITTHRTGVDHSKFRPLNRSACRARQAVPNDGKLIVTVGALIERKGQQLVIRALQNLPDVRLALAGVGPDKAQLTALAAELGLADRVHFLGAVPHERLGVLLAAADVFVLPSASEGLANAWVEALACGTPVVAADIPGARELITRPDYGRLVDRDPAAIAEAVRNLIESPPEREVIVEAAAGFDWDINAAELVAYWRRLAKFDAQEPKVPHDDIYFS